jgi:hypothetical protein
MAVTAAAPTALPISRRLTLPFSGRVGPAVGSPSFACAPAGLDAAARSAAVLDGSRTQRWRYTSQITAAVGTVFASWIMITRIVATQDCHASSWDVESHLRCSHVALGVKGCSLLRTGGKPGSGAPRR